MSSSQEKTLQNFNTIEKNIGKTIQEERKQNIIEKYMQFIQQENQFEIEDKNSLTTNHQSLYKNVQNCPLASRYMALQETVELYKKLLKELEEEIINLTIQSIADTESFKIQEAEREKPIKHFYQTEENRLTQELENVHKECAKIEQEIKDQMGSIIIAKNAKMDETKNNLQTQIIEKNIDFFNLQNENRELRKKLDDLKLKTQQNAAKANYSYNVIYFEEQHLANKVQQNYLFKKPNTSTTNHDKPKDQLLDEAANHKTLTENKSRESNNFISESEEFTEVAITSKFTESGKSYKFKLMDKCAVKVDNQFNLTTKPEFQNEYIEGERDIKTTPSELKINSMNIDPLKIINPKDPNDVIKQYHLIETTNTSRMLPTLYVGKSKKAKQINKRQHN